MATQRFEDAHLPIVSPSLLARQMQMAGYSAAITHTHAIGSRGLRTDAERPDEAVVDLRLLGKGVSWALGIEGITALCLYGVWFLRHLWL